MERWRALHHASPLAIAKDGDDDIEGIERGLEGNVLVEVENRGDDVHNYPNEPLLEVLARQCPDADDGEGGGERIRHRHTRIGAGDEEEID